MIYSTLRKIYFSPSGSTAAIINKIGALFNISQTEHNFSFKNIPDISFANDEFLIVASPVFSGRIPAIYIEKLKKIKGNGTPAIIIAVYGNRDYEDALIELKDTLESQGFIVMAAAALIARHSIFPQVANDRPDVKDDAVIAEFTQQCIKRLEQMMSVSDLKSVEVKGNRPYRAVANIPLHPSADAKCQNCGACVKVCPVGAIDVFNQKTYDKKKCISCTACIKACAYDARNFRGLLYWFVKRKFTKAYSSRKEPEIFL